MHPLTPRARGRLSRAMALVLVLPATAQAGPGDDSETPTQFDRRGKQQIGASWDPARAVWADEGGRMQVRGDRPEGASVHVAFEPFAWSARSSGTPRPLPSGTGARFTPRAQRGATAR